MARGGKYRNMQTISPGLDFIAGSFTTAGASAPTAVAGRGFSVAAPSTGDYTITLDQAYKELISLTCSLEQATSAAQTVIPLDSTDVTASTPVVHLETHSAAGTEANLTGPVVHFLAICRRTTVSK